MFFYFLETPLVAGCDVRGEKAIFLMFGFNTFSSTSCSIDSAIAQSYDSRMRYTTVVAFAVGLLLGRFLWIDSVKGQTRTDVPTQGVNIDFHNIHVGMTEGELRKALAPPIYSITGNADKLFMWKNSGIPSSPRSLLGTVQLQNSTVTYITKVWGGDEQGKDSRLFWNAIIGEASSSFGTTRTKAIVYCTSERTPESQRDVVTIELPGRSVDIIRFENLTEVPFRFTSYSASEDFAPSIGRE